MPDPIPFMVLGRLAVNLAWQHHYIGRAFLRDAILRTLQVAEIVGVKALLVHALLEQAGQFSQNQAFHASLHPITWFLPLK